MTTMETWTFYLRRLFLFARLSFYFIAVLRLKKSSTLLLAPVLASTQHSSHRKCYWYIFSQNGYFWNSVWPALSSAICHSRGVPTDWEWWFFVTHGGSQLTFEMFIWPNLSFQIRNKLLPTRSSSSKLVITSTSLKLWVGIFTRRGLINQVY